MRSSIHACSGHYELQEILHAVRSKGKVIVIDHVPAEVRSYCGDVLLRPETVRRIQRLLKDQLEPTGSAPVYQFA